MADPIDLSDVIGVWCSLIEKLDDDTGELEPGFYLGSIFVSMKDVMRFYGRNG